WSSASCGKSCPISPSRSSAKTCTTSRRAVADHWHFGAIQLCECQSLPSAAAAWVVSQRSRPCEPCLMECCRYTSAMRWLTAMLAPALAGCSLIYNPNNLPNQVIDAPVPVADANDSMLMLLDVQPAVINEGQGDGGSAPALFVIHGHNFVNNNLKVVL